MTAKTSQNLADTLRLAGFKELATRAEADEFHDFLSPHAMPELVLNHELSVIAEDITVATPIRMLADDIRNRLHDGDFDASMEESDEWAESPEGKAAMQAVAQQKGKTS
jgi:hypothetical protein